MSTRLHDALLAVRERFGAAWYKEPQFSHTDAGFYRAKEFLRGYLGGLVIIHQMDNQRLHDGTLYAMIDGKLESISF